MYKLLEDLYANEVSYTHMLYDDIGLSEDVLNYVNTMETKHYLT